MPLINLIDTNDTKKVEKHVSWPWLFIKYIKKKYMYKTLIQITDYEYTCSEYFEKRKHLWSLLSILFFITTKLNMIGHCVYRHNLFALILIYSKCIRDCLLYVNIIICVSRKYEAPNPSVWFHFQELISLKRNAW